MEETYKGLYYGTSQFTLVGEVQLNDNSFGELQLNNKGNYQWLRTSFGVKTSEGNIVYVTLMGGYSIDGGRKEIFVLTKDGAEKISWELRNNEEVIDALQYGQILRVGLEEDEHGKLDVKEFVSEIDMSEYLEEHLRNGAKVRITGEIEYQEYQGEITKSFHIKNIFTAEDYEKDGELIVREPLARMRQTYILDEFSLNDRWEKQLEEDGKITVGGYVPQYIGKQNGKPVRMTLPLKQTFVVKANKEDLELKKKTISRLFKVERNKVREITLVNDIREGYEQVQGEITMNPQIQELIDMGILSEESLEEQTTIRGNRISEVIYFQPGVTVNKDGAQELMVYNEKYTREELDKALRALENTTGEHEQPITTVNSSSGGTMGDTISDDELDSFFN